MDYIGTPYHLRPIIASEVDPEAHPGMRAAVFLTDSDNVDRQAFLHQLELGQDYEILLRPRPRNT